MKQLTKEQKKLLQELKKCDYFIKGSINDYCANCNRATCLCAVKTKLRSYRLTYKDSSQKTKTIYLPRERIREVKTMIRNYQKFKNISQKLFLTNIQIFKELAK
jgi:hypothetical protein